MTARIKREWAIRKARLAFGLKRIDPGTVERLGAVLISLLLSLAVLVPLSSASGATVESISRAMGF